MAWESLVIAAGVIMVFVTTFITLSNAYKNFKDLRKPSEELRKTVEHHSECLDRDNKALRHLQETDKVFTKILTDVLEHEIHGNHLEQLKESKDDLIKHLTSID